MSTFRLSQEWGAEAALGYAAGKAITRRLAPRCGHARTVAEKLRPMLGYLNRLHRRMEKVGFLAGDPALKFVAKARDAMHELTIDLHYQSCAHQTGRRPEPESK